MSVTLGCLLHDVGKLCYRAGESGRHSSSGYAFIKDVWRGYDSGPLTDCIRWHHSVEIREAMPPAGSLAYIAWEADNISAAADRRSLEEAGGSFEKYLPLSPVFTHLNGEHPGKSLSPKPQDGTLRMPCSGNAVLSEGDYSNICRELKKQLEALPPEAEWTDSLLSLLESYTGNIPSSTNTGESPDISLYDHAKICAAVGACISEYLLDRGITDFRKTIWDQEAAFRQEKVFLLYSADFSGIQKFIYTVSTKNALRSLRSRSFFLEMAMEHYIDELLSVCSLSRANLLYSGGGHCYLLLPNSEAVKAAVQSWNTRFNEWLTAQFGISLYLADGFTECSADELTNTPAEEAPYREMFRRVSSAVSKKKLRRYSAQQIIAFNKLNKDTSGRECRVCGRTDSLIPAEDGTSLCPWCSAFEKTSAKIIKCNVFVLLDGEQKNADFILPTVSGSASFLITDIEHARQMLEAEEQVIRIYTKNEACAGLKYSAKIYIGDYAASSSMEELAGSNEGIRRIGVCRMDVDDLGQAFVCGFEQSGKITPAAVQHYVTISRTAAFSRQLSLFFKLYINPLLSGEYGGRPPLNVAVVYSGGDDIFLVGAWSDAMKAARRIRSALQEYSCNSLTISGGVGVFDAHHPIRLAAQETAQLEDEAKARPGKNSISLFAPGSGSTYSWDAFEKDVLNTKLAELERFFTAGKTERGTAFLYRILELLRQADDENEKKMPLARLAYLLSRLEPQAASAEYRHYREFSSQMFEWAASEKERKSLITAIYLFVYKNRGKEDKQNGI